jgi:hypothetical protein
MRNARRLRSGQAIAMLLMLLPAPAIAQELERVTFEDAVRRAVNSHPTVQQAAAGVRRALSIVQQVRARSLPSVDLSLSTNVIDPVTTFEGTSVTPRIQTLSTSGVSVPLLARAHGRPGPTHHRAGDRPRLPDDHRAAARRRAQSARARQREGALRLREPAVRGRPWQPPERAARAAGALRRRGTGRGGATGRPPCTGSAGRADCRRRPGRRRR